MDKDEQIRKRLKTMFRETIGETSLLGTIKDVDETKFTCTIIDDDNQLSYEDVRLTPVIDSKSGLVLIPKVGTWVLALRIESDDDWVVVSVSEVDKVKMKVDDNIIELTADGIKSEIGSTLFEQTASTFTLENSVASLKDVINLIIEATIIITPTTPADTVKLELAKTKLENLFT